jgi:hypothetical protein
MKPELLQFSIVVRGDAHNPSILNPDFLRMQGIVPPTWGWTTRQTMTTPLASSVEYTNNVSIQVTAETLQVMVGAENGASISKGAEIVRGYVKTLPHVRYTALGINFHSALLLTSPGELIRDRFLAKGAWRSDEVGAGVRLEYPLSNGRLRVTIDAGKKANEDAIVVHANFHRELTEQPAFNQIAAYLDMMQEDLESYNGTLAKLFEGLW